MKIEEIKRRLDSNDSPTEAIPEVDLRISLLCRQALQGNQEAIFQLQNELARLSNEAIFALFWAVHVASTIK